MSRFGVHILLYFCTAVVLAAQPASGEPADSTAAQMLLAEGDVHYKRFDNRPALDAYFKAYQEDPESFDVLARLARTVKDYGLDLLSQDRDREAESTFKQALEYAETLVALYPENPRSHYYLAEIKKNLALILGGRDKILYGREVETHCIKSLELDPDDPELLVTYAVFNRDIAHMNWVERTFSSAIFGAIPKGTPEDAVDMLQKAVELDPSLHIAQYEIARTYINLGLQEKAIPYLENAVSLPAQTSQDNRNRELANRMLDQLKK